MTKTETKWTVVAWTDDAGYERFDVRQGEQIVATTSDEASARLIAAAPDLVEALAGMLRLMDMLWEAVPWGKTFNLDAKLLNEAPIAARAALSRAGVSP